MIYKGKHVNWTPHLNGMYGWHVIDVRGIFLAQVNVDGRWDAFNGSGDYSSADTVGCGTVGNLEAAKAAAEKALLDAGILSRPPTTVYYEGKPVEWKAGDEYHLLQPRPNDWSIAIVSMDKWAAYRLVNGSFIEIKRGSMKSGDIEGGKAAAVECLIKHGILTTAAPVKKPAAETYVFNYRADKGGATAAVVVSRLPKETVVVYGVAFCAPSDEYDKGEGVRWAAPRLVTEPLSLSLPVGVQPKDIKAAILQALVIPAGNRLVR